MASIDSVIETLEDAGYDVSTIGRPANDRSAILLLPVEDSATGNRAGIGFEVYDALGTTKEVQILSANIDGQMVISTDAGATGAATAAGRPVANLHVGITKTTTYTVLVTDDLIQGDASGGAFTVTLPALADSYLQCFTIWKSDSGGNVVTVAGDGAETINGANTYTGLAAQYDSVTVQNVGAQWVITAGGAP